MAEDQELDKIIRWLNDELTEEEKKTFSNDDLLKYQQILSEIDKWTPDNKPLSLQPGDITKAGSTKKKGKVISMNRWTSLSIAASVILAMFIGFLFFKSNETVELAELGQTKEILLPDGVSKVTLASNAKVSWKDDDWSGDQRTLKLEGKAFFQVNPGSPFTVNTESGAVRVLGTSFEVSSFNESLSVKCFEGKVKATATDQQERIVTKGEAYLYYAGQWEDKQLLTDQKPEWLISQTRFDNAPLDEVLKMLKDQYNIETIAGEVNTNRRFTGTVPNDNLKLALDLIFTPLKIKYELDQKKLYLTE